MSLTPELKKQFDDLMAKHPVVLFMKGTKDFPQCGFSARAVQVLKVLGVDFKDVDAQWPTIPQLYVRGEFVGGSDIMIEMYERGELQQMLGDLAKSA